jgi:hypothetical protein
VRVRGGRREQSRPLPGRRTAAPPLRSERVVSSSVRSTLRRAFPAAVTQLFAVMDNVQLFEALNGLALSQKFLRQEIAVLSRKRVTKRDPYNVLHAVLLHLYCVRDVDRFSGLFERFIAAEMDFHFRQDFELWSYVEGSILLYSDLTGDMKCAQRIRDKGFVPERLEGSMIDLNVKNLKAELGEFEKGHLLPKETILWRYQSLITECLLIIHFKKTGWFGSHKQTKALLERYRQLCLAGEGHFDQEDEQFLAALKTVSDNLF